MENFASASGPSGIRINKWEGIYIWDSVNERNQKYSKNGNRAPILLQTKGDADKKFIKVVFL